MKTEQRYLLAVFLSFLVLVVFYSPMAQRRAGTRSTVEPRAAEKSIVMPAAIPPADFSKPPEIRTEVFELSNDFYSAKWIGLGGGISELVLKPFGKMKTRGTELIKSENGAQPAFALEIPNQSVRISSAEFKAAQVDLAGKKIDLTFEVPGELRVSKRYELFPDRTAFRLQVRVDNLSGSSEKQVPLELHSQIYFGKEGTRYDQDQLESFTVPKVGKIKVIKEGKLRRAAALISEPIEWQALTKRYFTVIVKPDREAISVESRLSGNHEALESVLRFAPQTVPPGGGFETSFLIYAGPEYYEDLKSFGFGFEQTLSQGTWGLFRHWLFLALRLCEKLSGNYGFAIMLMTLLIKVLFSPFTHMSFDSMRKMQVVQPKLKAIQTQFKNDPTRMNKEMMELYRRHKVNPMGGCLPMLIQIPIFIGFYQVLAQFVELKGESFWWVKDLTEPDRLWKIPGVGFDLNLLPILMIGTMIWQQKVTPQQSMGSPEQAKMMQYMPIVMGFLFYQLPSGLVLYWTLNNLLTVIHQKLFHKSAPQISAE